MTKDVLIHVTGLQMPEGPDSGSEEPIEIIVPGSYYFRNGNHYLRYEEILDDSGEPTVNYVRISGESMEVRKKGLVNVHMVFERGKKSVAYYTTPFGTISMGIAATGLHFEESENNMKASVEYALELNDQYAADCTLELLILAKHVPENAELYGPRSGL